MARNERTADDFDSIAKQLSDASAAVHEIAEMIRKNGVPSVLIHGSTTTNRFLPAVLEWIDKTSGDVKSQVRSYLSGTRSNAEFQKQQSEKQKISAAKKATKKKP